LRARGFGIPTSCPTAPELRSVKLPEEDHEPGGGCPAGPHPGATPPAAVEPTAGPGPPPIEPQNALRRPAVTFRGEVAESGDGSPDRHFGPDRRLSFRYPVDSVEVQIAWSTVTSGDSTRPSCSNPHSGGSNGEEQRLTHHAQFRPARPPAGGGESEVPPVSTSLVRHTAQIVDLSQMGLSLLSDHPPPSDRKLWIGIVENSLLSWSEVTLRSLSHLAPGVYLLRLSFQETCPYELFKAAVLRKGTSTLPPGSTGSSASPQGRA
jgi:hypothetical protein